jgi:cytochrome P450
MERLCADPSQVPTAVEELLRYDGPVQATGRVAMEDLEIGGQKVTKGQAVLTVLGAANRDPAQFGKPDELDLDRQPNEHVAFGDGIHFCLGAPLARAEGQIAFETLLRRFAHPRLETDNLQWGGSFILRGLESLPVTF